MQIVIDICKDDFDEICMQARMVEDTGSPFGRIRKSIFHGTPLPKGHGRLIDADKLKEVYENTEDAEYCKWTLYGVKSEIDDAETVIEADKAESEDEE